MATANKLKLTEKETEIMRQLWEGDKTVRELLEAYPDPKPHFNTVSTVVRILVEKGFVTHVGERNGAFLYHACVAQNSMARRSLTNVVKSFFNNDYFSVVSTLVKEEKINIDELRELIEELEKKSQ